MMRGPSCPLESSLRYLLRNPAPIAALTFEHVKPSSGGRVKLACEVVGLFPAFLARRGNRIFRRVGLFHAAQNGGKILLAK
jgi:hypothetical protein